MDANDPIRMNQMAHSRVGASAVTRQEAERQFKLSFALVVVLTMATLTAVATMPMTGWHNGYALQAQLNTSASLTR